MSDRLTDRAKRVVVLAQEEARMLRHKHIGPEHILLGLLREGEGAAAMALKSLGFSLEAVRHQVEEITGRGKRMHFGHLRFAPNAKEALQLSAREALELGSDHIDTEHILLGLIREREGVASQLLQRLGADAARIRRQVIPVDDYSLPGPTGTAWRDVKALSLELARLDAMERRLAAIEQRAGMVPDTSDLDGQIKKARCEKETAIDAQDFKRAASLRDREKQLLDSKAAREHEWSAKQHDLPTLSARCQQLSDEIERLRALLRQHGIEADCS